MKLNDSEEYSDSNGLIFLQFSLFSVFHLLLHRVVRDAWRSLGLLGDFEHQVVDELLSGGVAGHGRLAHLRRTTSRSHLTVHQRHLGKGKKKIKTCRDVSLQDFSGNLCRSESFHNLQVFHISQPLSVYFALQPNICRCMLETYFSVGVQGVALLPLGTIHIILKQRKVMINTTGKTTCLNRSTLH